MDDYSENNNNNNDLNNLESSNNTISNDSSNPIGDMNNATPVDMSNISPTTLASNNSDESEANYPYLSPLVEEYSFSKDETIQKKEGIKKFSKKALQIMKEEGLTEEEYKAKYENKKEDDRTASEDDVEYYVSNYDLEDYKEENKYNIDTEEHHKSVVERKKKEREAARLRKERELREKARLEAERKKKQQEQETYDKASDLVDSGEFPRQITDLSLECIYIGLLLNISGRRNKICKGCQIKYDAQKKEDTSH